MKLTYPDALLRSDAPDTLSTGDDLQRVCYSVLTTKLSVFDVREVT